MVTGEGAVDAFVQQEMLAGQRRRNRRHRFAHGAVAGVPGHLQAACAAGFLENAGHIGLEDRYLAHPADAVLVIGSRGQPPQFLNLGSKDGGPVQNQLEAVVVRWIMRAGNHDAAVDLHGISGKIQHRRRATANPQHLQAAGREAGAQRLGQLRRRMASVVADCERLGAAAPRQATEGAAEGEGVVPRDRLADDTADVVFPKHGRVEVVRRQRVGQLRDTHSQPPGRESGRPREL